MQNNENKMQKTDKKPRFERRNAPKADDMDKKLVDVRRVTKVVKGGKTFRFSALVVVGDKKGKVGMAIGKATEVPAAIEKAGSVAKRNMVKVSLDGTTIPHEIIGKFGKSMVKLMPAKEGTGVIAGGAVRPVVELCGIKDIKAKIYGSRNKVNCVKATIQALNTLRSAEEVAALRGKTVEEIL